MGYVLCYGSCVNCHKVFAFNPHLVPSAVIDGVRREICQECVEWVNPIRKQKGLPEIEILPGAYDPMDEREL